MGISIGSLYWSISKCLSVGHNGNAYTLYQTATVCECSVPDHFVFIIYIFMICGLAMLNHENMIGMVNLLVKESEIHIGNWKLPAPQSHDKTPIIACVISNQSPVL